MNEEIKKLIKEIAGDCDVRWAPSGVKIVHQEGELSSYIELKSWNDVLMKACYGSFDDKKAIYFDAADYAGPLLCTYDGLREMVAEIKRCIHLPAVLAGSSLFLIHCLERCAGREERMSCVRRILESWVLGRWINHRLEGMSKRYKGQDLYIHCLKLQVVDLFDRADREEVGRLFDRTIMAVEAARELV